MPRGQYERQPRPPLGPSQEDRLTTLELQREADEERIAKLERRIQQMNEAFERGYLPANVQTHS